MPGGGLTLLAVTLKMPSILQKKRPFLGKQQGKTRQVDLAGVHFRFAKVRVYGYGQFQTGSEIVEHVESRFAGDGVLSTCASMQPAPPRERLDIETDALREAFKIRDFARLRNIKELCLQKRPQTSGLPLTFGRCFEKY